MWWRSFGFFLFLLPVWVGAFSFEVPLLENWRYTFGDNFAYKQMGYNDYGWQTVEFPTTAFMFKGEDTFYTWLRRYFSLPAEASNRQLGLYTGRIHDAVEIYVNGILIGISGSQPPRRYFGTPHTPRGFLLPPEILRFEGTNLIAIRVYTHKKQGAFGEIVIAPYEEVRDRVRMESFLGLGIPHIVTIISVFMLLYFVVLFLKNRDVTNLFLGVGVFLLGIFYMDIYIEYLPIGYLLKHQIMYGALYIGFPFLIVFFQFFYGFRAKLIGVLAFVMGVGATLLNFLMPDLPTWEFVMGTVVHLVWVLPALLCILGTNVVAIFQKKPYAWLMLVGSFFAVSLSLRDVFSVVLFMWERYWTSSWGMLLFIVSMFISMALRAADVQRESRDKEEKLGLQKNEIQGVLTEVSHVAEELGKTSRELDTEISSAQFGMEHMVDLSKKMRDKFLAEVKVLAEGAKTTMSLVSDIEKIMQHLRRENALVQDGAKGFQDIIGSLQSIFDDLQNLRDLSEQLKVSVVSSQQQTKASQEALQNLAGRSENVFVLLGNIQRIADDTNTLAINAAIQSAHAGEYGKSFAIVGQEVRNLAMSVAKLADTVTGEIQQMSTELGQTRGHFSNLEKNLEDTMREMDGVNALLQKLQGLLGKQQKNSQHVASTVEELSGVIQTLFTAFDQQKQKVEGFYNMLQGIEKMLGDFINRLDTQREKEEKILAVMQSISNLSQQHKAIVTRLFDLSMRKTAVM